MKLRRIFITLVLLFSFCTSTIGNIEKYTNTRSQCLRGDCFNGFGIQQTDEIETYIGQFVSGKYHGKGEFRCRDKALVKGHFLNGVLEGEFEMELRGEKISGNIHDGEYEGVIRISSPKYKKLDTFEMTYKRGVLHGTVFMSYDSGKTKTTLYFKEGTFVSGKLESNNKGVLPIRYSKIKDGPDEKCYLHTTEKPNKRLDDSGCLEESYPRLHRGCNGI